MQRFGFSHGVHNSPPPLAVISLSAGSSACINNSIKSPSTPIFFLFARNTWTFLESSPRFMFLLTVFYLCIVSPPVGSSLSLLLGHCVSFLHSFYSLFSPVYRLEHGNRFPLSTCSGISSTMITPDPFHAELGKQFSPNSHFRQGK